MISKRKRNKVMKILCKQYYKEYSDRFSFYFICNKTKYNPVESKQILMNLEANGFIKYFTKEEIDRIESKNLGLKNIEKSATQDFVSLTDKGKCYFENKSDEMWKFIRRSIIIPAIVSVATTIIISLIQNLILQCL